MLHIDKHVYCIVATYLKLAFGHLFHKTTFLIIIFSTFFSPLLLFSLHIWNDRFLEHFAWEKSNESKIIMFCINKIRNILELKKKLGWDNFCYSFDRYAHICVAFCLLISNKIILSDWMFYYFQFIQLSLCSFIATAETMTTNVTVQNKKRHKGNLMAKMNRLMQSLAPVFLYIVHFHSIL